MRTHLGCVGRVSLGDLSEETRKALETVEATWLEFAGNPPSLVVRHVQPSDTPILPNVGGELLDFLGRLTEDERAAAPGGALYCLDEESGQYIRLRASSGGALNISWARPDYSRGRWQSYGGEHVPVVFEAYQRLNGKVKFSGAPDAVEKIRAAAERTTGLYPEGELETRVEGSQVEISLRDVNSSVLELFVALREAANPAASLEGEIDVSSFRPGDLEDYCRFVMKDGEVWLVRPSLWSEAPGEQAAPGQTLQSAA
jgi:hypothetical protein